MESKLLIWGKQIIITIMKPLQVSFYLYFINFKKYEWDSNLLPKVYSNSAENCEQISPENYVLILNGLYSAKCMDMAYWKSVRIMSCVFVQQLILKVLNFSNQ